MNLAELKSRAYKAGEPPLGNSEAEEHRRQVPAWALGKNVLEREFRFKDFRQAMEFVNKVAAVADQEDHHPDMLISYNKVKLTLTTHRIDGLSLNDFIVAAKIDRLL